MGHKIVFLIFLSFLAGQAEAQVLLGVESMSIELSPEFPAPLSEVGAKLVTFTFDADRSQMQWLVNGRTLAQGAGVKEVLFKVGPAGSVSNLKIIVTLPTGKTLEHSLEIRPQEIDLLVEPKNFIPYWYKGGRVISPGSEVRVAAFPHFIFEGGRLNPQTLVYNWKIDGEVRGDLSGRGKESVSFKMLRVSGEPIEVSVQISSPQETLRAEARTFIRAKEPKILFYERRPLVGLLSAEALFAKTILAGENLEISAMPFFMNFKTFQELNFNWNFDGREIKPNPQEPNVFLVRSIPGTKGQATLGLKVGHLENILEELRGALNVYVQ